MFTFAIFLGLFSYWIFFLGIFHLLFPPIIIGSTFLAFCTFAFFYRKKIIHFFSGISFPADRLSQWILALLCIQVIINSIGALGPELGFDALWYHLTLPKLYLLKHAIYHISGNIFYYSDMPKLTEMLYVVGLSFGSEIYAKVIHFSFGLLCCIALFIFSRKFLSKQYSLLVVLVFYANLVVGWESISAYIDLSRTFFEFLALFAFVQWYEKKKDSLLIIVAILTGFAIGAKYLSVSSIVIFTFFIFIANKLSLIKKLTNVLLFWAISFVLVLPWLVLSYVNTGNPVYPFFASAYPISFPSILLNPANFVFEIWNLFIYSADPISPIYLAFLPIIILALQKASKSLRLLYIYCGFALVIWYFTPRTGGGRFILPYLPVFSLIAISSLATITQKNMRRILIGCIFLACVISILYRGIANAKFIPVLLKYETKSQFLSKHLNFNYGDFYDTDGYFASHIKRDDTVLLIGFTNLYYVNFPFIDASWYKSGEHITYIATQHRTLPKEFNQYKQIYWNPLTDVKLYANN